MTEFAMRCISLVAVLVASLTPYDAGAVTACRVDGKIIYTRECMQQQSQASDELHHQQQSAIEQSASRTVTLDAQPSSPGRKPNKASQQPTVKVPPRGSCAAEPLFKAVATNDTSPLKACGDPERLGKLVNEQGRTLLHESAANGNLEVAGYLLSLNIPLEQRARGDRGGTALHLAAANNQAQIIRMLHEAGANLEARDYLKRSPLHLASGNAAISALELLVRLRADIHSTDRANRTPLLVASQQPNSRALLKSLLDAGADINHRTNRAMTALHYAAVTDTDSTELLLSRGIGLNDRNHLGETPLLYAVNDGIDAHWPRLQLMVEAGADLNATANDQNTLLKIAYREQHEPLLSLLLKHGVDTRNVASFIEAYRETQSNL